MEYTFRKAKDSDREDILNIFNHSAYESFAVYSDKELDFDLYEKYKKISKALYVIEIENQIIGFGYLKPFSCWYVCCGLK